MTNEPVVLHYADQELIVAAETFGDADERALHLGWSRWQAEHEVEVVLALLERWLQRVGLVWPEMDDSPSLPIEDRCRPRNANHRGLGRGSGKVGEAVAERARRLVVVIALLAMIA